jgi:hypothetical protein
MGKASVPRKTRTPKDTGGPIASPPKGLTLADLTVTHAVGRRPMRLTGETLVRLIEGTRHLHDDSADDLDFINPYAIAIELDGLADVLCCVSETEEFSLRRALPCLGEQLRRIGHRVTALAERSGNNAPNWYAVEVKK